jgi:hypothetical protein
LYLRNLGNGTPKVFNLALWVIRLERRQLSKMMSIMFKIAGKRGASWSYPAHNFSSMLAFFRANSARVALLVAFGTCHKIWPTVAMSETIAISYFKAGPGGAELPGTAYDW